MNTKKTCEKRPGKMSRYACMVVMIAMFGMTPLSFAETETPTAPAAKMSIQDIKQQTQELIQSLKAYTVEQRNEAMQKTKEALANLDKRIDELERNIDCKWDKMDDAARQKATVTLRALREQRIQVAEWYGSLQNSSADAWERVKNGFSEAYRGLDETWQKAEREYGSDK